MNNHTTRFRKSQGLSPQDVDHYSRVVDFRYLKSGDPFRVIGFEFGGARMKVEVKDVNRPVVEVNHVRGPIVGFSAASRRRLQELVCSLSVEARMASWLGRLSWSDDRLPIDGLEVKRCLNQLGVELKKSYPRVAMIWRCELAARQSGEFTGMYQPHVHFVVASHPGMSGFIDMLLFGLEVATAWHRITKCSDPDHLVFEKGWHILESYGHPRAWAYYVSKYHSKAVEQEALQDAERGFNWSGRWWGIFNRACLPLAEKTTGRLTELELVQLKRLVRAWLRRWRGGRGYGKYIAGSGGEFGFMCLGLPEDTGRRMVNHACELAASRS